jgi:hypothetical protein
MPAYTTKFGSLNSFEKGGVEVIQDDAKNYVFSNVYDVASRSKPYEKVCVGRNNEYALEVLRAEGTSGWRAGGHDEFALIMDGDVEVRLVKLDQPVPDGTNGSVAIPGDPQGKKMGVVKAGKGHMVLLPVGSAYQFHAGQPAAILLQTLAGQDTVYKWSEICQTM